MHSMHALVDFSRSRVPVVCKQRLANRYPLVGHSPPARFQLCQQAIQFCGSLLHCSRPVIDNHSKLSGDGCQERFASFFWWWLPALPATTTRNATLSFLQV